MNDNTSIRKWNWGAFWMSWVWGLGNRTWIALLSLIPVVNLVMAFVLGAKGNAWALKNKKWESDEKFYRVQGLWSAFGWGFFAGCAIVIIIVAITLAILFTNVFM